MKTYILTLSEFFPKTHSKAGMPTHFKETFLNREKKHTIRSNYPLWEKRIKEVQEGKAVLSVRQWTGKPYHSKQVEIARLTAEDGVGIQKIRFYKGRDGTPSLPFLHVENELFFFTILASYDGLTLKDWQEWFRGYDFSKPLAIIHFTKFRY